MTREEAIAVLTATQVVYFAPNGKEKVQEALDMAIKALSAEPTVIRCRTLLSDEDFKAFAERICETNQNIIVIPCEAEVVSTETSTETSTDFISRADAKEAIRKMFSNLEDRVEINTILNEVPSVSAERSGTNLEAEYPSLFTCSNCGASCNDTLPWDCEINYCPNCGARMKGGDTE